MLISFMKEINDSNRALSVSSKHLPSWLILSLFAFICYILVGVFQFISPTRAIAITSFLIYPFAIFFLALLVNKTGYVNFFEVRLLAVLFLWMVFVTLLYNWQVDGPISSSWFQSICTTIFLFFSIPYTFNNKENIKALEIFALVLTVAITLLSTAGLLFALISNVYSVPGNLQVFGMGSNGRLHLLCHPNSMAPTCGTAIVMIGYLFIQIRKRFPRILLSMAMLICFFTLALTGSSAGVVSASLALGFELFLVSNVKLFHRRSKLIRILLSAFVALIGIFIIYQGTKLVRNGYNRFVMVATTEYSVVNDESESIDTSSEHIDNRSAAQSNANDLAGVESDLKSVSSKDLSDFGTFNGRTAIWLGVLKGLVENPKFLAIGIRPLVAGKTMAPYFPENSPIGNFHNSFLSVLVSFGIPGLVLVLVFLILVAIACVRLSFSDLKNRDALGIRVVSAILLFTVSVSMLEAFLFADGSPNIVWIWFMFASGFVFRTFKKIIPRLSAIFESMTI